MAYLRRKYYNRDEDMPKGLKALYAGYEILREHPLFSQLRGTISAKASHLSEKNSIACVTKNGDIYVHISDKRNAILASAVYSDYITSVFYCERKQAMSLPA